jgi:hypothetical protein
MEGGAVISVVDTVSKEGDGGEPGRCSWNGHHVLPPAGEEERQPRANMLGAHR